MGPANHKGLVVFKGGGMEQLKEHSSARESKLGEKEGGGMMVYILFSCER